MFSWGWSTQQSLILSILTSHRSALIIVHYRSKYLGCSLSPKLFSKMFVILFFCQQCRKLWLLRTLVLVSICNMRLCDRCVVANVYHLLLTIDAEHLFLWFLAIIYYLWWCVCSSLLPIFLVALLLHFKRLFFLVVTVFLSVDWFVFETGFSMYPWLASNLRSTLLYLLGLVLKHTA